MGKNWMTPAEMAKDTAILAAWALVLAGMAAWDVISTLPFDISIIRGRRPWRWPMVLYFVCRICMLLHIFAFAVNLNAISEVPCQQVVWISKVTDAIGTCCSSIILLLRTTAVWHQNKFISIPLSLLSLAQMALWSQTFRFSVSVWNPQRGVCQVVATAPNALIVSVFSYTMAFDFVIMVLCTFRLWKSRNHSGIGSLLFRDGIVYFCAAFGANLVQTVMASLALNPVMNIFALPFALVVSVIAATTVFRNVFTMYDSFARETSTSNSNPSGSVSANVGGYLPGAHSGVSRLNVGTRGRRASVSKHTDGGDTFQLGELRSVEIHKVVEVQTDNGNGPYMSTAFQSQSKMKPVPEDDRSSFSSGERNEKGPRAL